MRAPRTLTTLAGLVLMLTLASCGASGDADSTGDASDEAQTGAGEVYQDTVETRRADLGAAALEEELSGAAASGETLALDVLVQRAGSSIEEDVDRSDDEIAMAFVGEGDDAAYEIVGAPQVFGGEQLGKRPVVRGAFAVEASEPDDGTLSYTLTRTGEIDPAPRTGGEMCQSEGVDERASDAAAALPAASLEEYGALRDEWATAPQLWAAIKSYAARGDGESDAILDQLCAQHRE